MTTDAEIKATAAARTRAAKAKVTGEDDVAAEGAIEVRGPEGGRRRAGFKFTPVALVIRRADLTASQLAAIEADPLLTVKDVAIVAPEIPTPDSVGGAGEGS